MDIIRKIYYFILSFLNREYYARKIGVKMGDNVKIYGNPFNMFGSEPWCVNLGNNVFITKDVLFLTHDGGTLVYRPQIPNLEITKPIFVGNNVFIGVRSIIMPGIVIGNDCIIAAGSVVTKNVPDHSVIGGNPAKFIKTTKDYLDKLELESLHLGHLKGKEKEIELKKLFNQ